MYFGMPESFFSCFFNPLFILNISIGKRLFPLPVQLRVISRLAGINLNRKFNFRLLSLNFYHNGNQRHLKLTISLYVCTIN